MKRLIALFGMALILMGAGWGWNDLQKFLNSPHTWNAEQTFSEGLIAGTGSSRLYVELDGDDNPGDGDLWGPTSDVVRMPNVEGGNSPYALPSGTTYFSTSVQLNKWYTTLSSGTHIVEIRQTPLAGQKLVLIDATTSGAGSAVSLWSGVQGVSIWFGVVSAALSGTTWGWPSGTTGQVLGLYAPKAGMWRIIASEVTPLMRGN